MAELGVYMGLYHGVCLYLGAVYGVLFSLVAVCWYFDSTLLLL